MTRYVALLRAVNLGASTTLRMADLRAMATDIGFTGVATYIASGNLLFDSDEDEAAVKARLEARLTAHAGRPVPTMIRTAAEMAAVRDNSPFPDAPGNRVLAILLDRPPAPDALAHARHVDGERMALGLREIYVRYTDDGMGRSKLVIPAAAAGTARNMNTIAKLAALAASPP